MQKEEQIHIVPYDPSWPIKFEKEKKLLEETVGKMIIGGIHHVGSTSIPGLVAKPIIDIMVGVKNLDEGKKCIPLLEKIQYCFFPYKPDKMVWFCKPSPYKRTHHLHLIRYNSSLWKKRFAFRDYLRSNPKAIKEYENLKLKLADKFKDDREAYTEAKTKFVESIIKKALRGK